MASIDLPRGGITEIFGKRSSGRTSLLHSILADYTGRSEVCAIVDSANSFDPASAATAGVNLSRLVWIRSNGHAGHAMKAADLVLHGGGFGMVVLDLCDLPPRILRNIPLSYWYRFRLAIESTPTILIVLGAEPNVRATSLRLEIEKQDARWAGATPFELLREVRVAVTPRKPARNLICTPVYMLIR